MLIAANRFCNYSSRLLSPFCHILLICCCVATSLYRRRLANRCLRGANLFSHSTILRDGIVMACIGSTTRRCSVRTSVATWQLRYLRSNFRWWRRILTHAMRMGILRHFRSCHVATVTYKFTQKHVTDK